GCARKPEIRPVWQVIRLEAELQLMIFPGHGEDLRGGEIPGKAFRTAHRVAAGVAECVLRDAGKGRGVEPHGRIFSSARRIERRAGAVRMLAAGSADVRIVRSVE